MKCPKCGKLAVTGTFCTSCGWDAPPSDLRRMGIRRIVLGVIGVSALFFWTVLDREISGVEGRIYLTWGVLALVLAANGVILTMRARSEEAKGSQSS